MIFETALIFGISNSYLIAACIAALVRLLLLVKQPPPPRPTKFEMGRQSLLTFVLVAFAEPAATLIGISAEYAILAGIAVSLHGTDQTAEYIKTIAKLLLPAKIAEVIEQKEAEEERKKIELSHNHVIEQIHELEEQHTADNKELKNDDDKRE